MAPRDERPATVGFVGRAPELAAIGALLAEARDGRGGALLVSGDAGVGKTRLLAHACTADADEFLVLSGACLPLSSLSVPLLPLRSAVRGLPAAQRPAVLTGAGADEVEDLARSARVPLTTPPVAAAGRSRATTAGLTPREREILGHVVAGRTYGEIARALVLSEKTVSSHISNILRKTACANRVDLARWATHGPGDEAVSP